jgi:hypothetical protein
MGAWERGCGREEQTVQFEKRAVIKTQSAKKR